MNREALWSVLEHLGCPPKLSKIFKLFHSGMNRQVLTNGVITEEFGITNGVKQGCVLVLVLLNLFFTSMLRHTCKDLDKGFYLKYRLDCSIFDLRRLNAKSKFSFELLQEALFADDCALVAHSEEDLQLMLDYFADAARLFCLQKLLESTEVLHQPAPKTAPNDATVPPSLLYRCESWTLYRKQLNRFKKFHKRALRSILGIHWQNKITNLEVFDRSNSTSMRSYLSRPSFDGWEMS